MEKIVEFKQKFAEFLKTLRYMQKKSLITDHSSPEWIKLCERFNARCVDPMDKLWSELLPGQRASF